MTLRPFEYCRIGAHGDLGGCRGSRRGRGTVGQSCRAHACAPTRAKCLIAISVQNRSRLTRVHLSSPALVLMSLPSENANRQCQSGRPTFPGQPFWTPRMIRGFVPRQGRCCQSPRSSTIIHSDSLYEAGSRAGWGGVTARPSSARAASVGDVDRPRVVRLRAGCAPPAAAT